MHPRKMHFEAEVGVKHWVQLCSVTWADTCSTAAARLSNGIYLLNVLRIGIYSVSQFSFKIYGNKKYFCYLKIDLNCISEGTACL